MNRIFASGALLRVPVHTRPLVLAMVVPLAASCLLVMPVSGQSLVQRVGNDSTRSDYALTIQERQRRFCESLIGEDPTHDPPARVHPWKKTLQKTSSGDVTKLASPTGGSALGTRNDFPQAPNESPDCFHFSTIDSRGPPAGGCIE